MAPKFIQMAATLAFLANMLVPPVLGAPAAPAKSAAKSAPAAAKSAAKSAAAKPATEAAKTAVKPAETKPAEPEEELAPVINPDNFFGAAAMGYAAAKANPKTCSKLFCYCGCDITDKHNNLLDCFTSMHGVDCHICQEEALAALRMQRDGQPLSAIQKQIDNDYEGKYPFKDESPALKRYRSTRLYTGGNTSTVKSASDSGEACCGSEKNGK